MIELTNITDEAMRNYHYLWYTYNNNNENFTLFCNAEYSSLWIDCTQEPLRYFLAEEYWHFELVEKIRNKSAEGIVIENNESVPPCSSQDIIKKFKIDTICRLIQNISANKIAFLNLMKYTKQSPVYSKGNPC